MKSLSDLLGILARSQIEYVVIGGFAGVLHGSTLVTRDLDVCTILSPENIDRLKHALAEFNPKHRMTPKKLSFIDVPRPGEIVKNLYLETDLGVIDILSDVQGVGDFNRIKSKSETIHVSGVEVRVISLEDLILAKSSMNRDKDRLALKELKAIQAKLNKQD